MILTKTFSRIITFMLMISTISTTASQNFTADDFFLENPTLVRNGKYMTASMLLNIQDLEINKNNAVVYLPMIVNGADTLRLKSVGVYGKTAWHQFQRGILKTVPADCQIAIKYSKNATPLSYQLNVDYEKWMNGSSLIVKRDFYGCAGCNKGANISEGLIAYQEDLNPAVFHPTLIYKAAQAEIIKARELSGRAYVDFPVNKIVIYPDYRNNTFELSKIIATIDSVKNDPDITVTSILIKGTASPEGPYENNVYLAKNRTIALKEYVTNLYDFPKDFIQTDYEPVDWNGLRDWLENNNLNHRQQILAIVNSNIAPYERNSKIKKDFPVEYEWLLLNVYPALRHSDYRIEYQIRQYTTVEEIAEVLKTAPQKLSLNEIYTLASTLQPGSPEFNEVFEIAVRMYPNDETANLNAANAAMARGDYVFAQRYLLKSGCSPEADYARGMFAGLQGDFSSALEYLRKAQDAGFQNINEVIEQIQSLQNHDE